MKQSGLTPKRSADTSFDTMSMVQGGHTGILMKFEKASKNLDKSVSWMNVDKNHFVSRR